MLGAVDWICQKSRPFTSVRHSTASTTMSSWAGRLDTVPSAHSRSLASVRFLPQTRTPLYVGAKCGRPHRGWNRALTTTGTSVEALCFNHSATEGTHEGELISKFLPQYTKLGMCLQQFMGSLITEFPINLMHMHIFRNYVLVTSRWISGSSEY